MDDASAKDPEWVSNAMIRSAIKNLESRNFYGLADEVRQMSGRIERLTAEVTREERAHGETIDQRDRAEKWADKLAYAIGEHFGVDVGEHSNMNCPWEEALDAIPTVRADQNLTKEETP